MFVTVTTVYENKKNVLLTGTIEDAGINFLLLNRDDKITIIPFERILSIHCDHKESISNSQTKLSAYNDRQGIVQHFGTIVAKSPFLINRFFGLPLHIYLNSYVGCDVRIKVGSLHSIVTGSIIEALSHTVELRNQHKSFRVDYDDLLYIDLFITSSE